MPRLTDTWYCVRCAKEGKPYVYVDKRKKECPSGHPRQSGKFGKEGRQRA